MRINYDTLRVFNEESLTNSGDQMACYWVIQSGVEKMLNGETITDIHKQLLIDLGIIE